MPVIVTSDEIHPFLPSLGSPRAIERARAERQEIRPLEICIINLMADKRATEKQLATWLGNTPLQVYLTFASPDAYVHEVRAGRETKNTPADHIQKFYRAWSEIKDRKFDGLIVTGVNALKPNIIDEDIWPDVRKILEWSRSHIFSSLFLCYGAQAALKHFHDIDSPKGTGKIFGLFDHHIASDETEILFGFPDIFPVPVSRWKSPKREDILKRAALEIVADSPESGPNIIVESASYCDGLYPQRLYILNHPEYDTDILGNEYRRDSALNPDTPLPLNYYPNNDPSQKPRNLWRHSAMIYSNWVKAVYEATPFNIADIPEPLRPEETIGTPAKIYGT